MNEDTLQYVVCNVKRQQLHKVCKSSLHCQINVKM